MRQYFNNIWSAISTIAIGMSVTFKHLFVPSVTIQYPDVKLELPERERNRLYVNMDDCIGCDQCARACPVNCITIETVKSLPEEDLGKTSNIDFAKCCYCELCVFPCPTECIYMTDVFEFSEYERKDLNLNFVTLTPEEIIQKKENFAKMEAEKARLQPQQAAKKAEEAAKAASEKKSADQPGKKEK